MAIPFYDTPDASAYGLDETKKRLQDVWKRTVLEWFPDMHIRPIFMPPVFFNRVAYEDLCIIDADTLVHVPKPATQLSDVREDESMSRIYHLLTQIFASRKEPVLLMFGLDFDNYLSSATADASVPPPTDDRTATGPELEEQLSLKVRSQGRALKKTSFVPYLAKTTTGRKASPSSTGTGVPSFSGGLGQYTSSAGPLTKQASSQMKERTFPFSRPRDLDSARQRGRFDILIIHKRCGIIVCEVKAIGDAFILSREGNAVSFQLETVRSRVRKSLKQLQKNQEVLRYLLIDLDPEQKIPIKTSLVFPNLKKQLFSAAILQDTLVAKEFCDILGARTAGEAMDKCLFSEQLPPMDQTGDITPDVLEGLRSRWWESLTNHPPCQIDYESLIARFCGPATKQLVTTASGGRVDVTTLQQGVLETHRRITAIVLSEEQVRTLQGDHRRVFITGPPGTGKTLMLWLKAKRCLAAGQDVVVVSLWQGSRTSSRALFKSLSDFGRLHGNLPKLVSNLQDLVEEIRLPTTFDKCREQCTREDSDILGSDDLEADGEGMTCEPLPPQSGSSFMGSAWEEKEGFDFPGRTVREGREYDFSPTPPAAVASRTPAPANSGRQVFLLLDEAPWFLDSVVQMLDSMSGRDEKDVQVAIWAASSFRTGRPESWAEVALSRHFRCPPAVVREMMRSYAYSWWTRYPFSSQDAAVLSAMPHPTEGPAVKRIDHKGHAQGVDIWQCRKCGQEVAYFLLRDLQIGIRSEVASATADKAVLQLSDVLISGFVPKLRSATFPSSPGSSSPSMDVGLEADGPGSQDAPSGLLQGLAMEDVRYDDLRRGRPEDVEKLVQPTDADRVQVARPENVLGLERPVVVVLATVDVTATYPRLVDPWFDVMSRCSAQLLVVGDMKPSVL